MKAAYDRDYLIDALNDIKQTLEGYACVHFERGDDEHVEICSLRQQEIEDMLRAIPNIESQYIVLDDIEEDIMEDPYQYGEGFFRYNLKP